MANRYQGKMGNGARKVVQKAKRVEAEARNRNTPDERRKANRKV